MQCNAMPLQATLATLPRALRSGGPMRARSLSGRGALAPSVHRLRRGWRTTARAWEAVSDPATGKVYYWNKSTNETAWENPEGESASAVAGVGDAGEEVGGGGGEVVDFPAMLEVMIDAATHKKVQFPDIANEYRDRGVFTDEFFDFISERIKAEPERREVLDKTLARLANPLLKHPPPF